MSLTMDINPDEDNERVFDSDSDDASDPDDDSDSDIETELSYITLFGRVTSTICTTSEEYVNMWIANHIHHRNCDPTRLIVGLHIELADPNNQYPNIATISVCVNGECLVYHMFYAMALPNRLQQFLTDPNNNITFIGVNLERQLRVLRNWAQYTGRITCRNLGFLAMRYYGRQWLRDANICELVYAVLRKRLVMPETNPDWDRTVLLQEHVLVASVRAYVPYELGRAIHTFLD